MLRRRHHVCLLHAEMFFCFESFAEGRCVGNLLGVVSTPEECCLIPDRGGLGGGGFVEPDNEDCTSCMTGKLLTWVYMNVVAL